MMTLRLLFHAPSLVPYPTNTASALCCIRFGASVRVTSVRITPEGVETLDNNIGVTYPSRWTGQVFFNTSNSDPINSLPTCEIQVEGGVYDQDFAVDMSEDVTTRMMILRAPIERVTISVYGYTSEDTATPRPLSPVIPQSFQEKEDWSWVHAWAGEISNLIDLLNDDTSPLTMQRALDTLDLLIDIDPHILDQIINHPTTLPFLVALPSYPVQPIVQRLYADPTYALHPSLRYHLPPAHPLRTLTIDDPIKRRKEAWKRLDLGRGALMILAEGHVDAGDLLEVEPDEDKSNLVRLVQLAQGHAEGVDEESKKSLEVVLDIILSTLPSLTDPPVIRYLTNTLPRLIVVSNIRHAPHSQPRLLLPFAVEHSRQVLQSLLRISTEVIHGHSAFSTTKSLAKPYLAHLDPTDPLVRSFDGVKGQPSLPSPRLVDTSDGRRLSRFLSALDDGGGGGGISGSNGIQHTLTPEEVLSIIAPSYLASLQSAPQPPLGISSVLANPTPESQASNWAGKVYSQHQFRSREAAPGIGLGIAPGMGRGMSRPASRHVDEYAK